LDVNAKIDELIEIVESARAMPMSTSCVINRAQVLELLDQLKHGLPEEMDRARRVLSDRESVLEEGRREAERLLERTRGERESIINNTDISREAQDAASRMLSQARREADQIRADADEYVDQKLANFEVVLTKTLQAVGRGRDKMRGSSNPMEELGRHVEEQDAAQAERKRSRDFSGTGEMPKVRGYEEEQGYPEPGFTGENAFAGENGFAADGGFNGDNGFNGEHGFNGDNGFETTGEFTRVAFEEAERPYEPHGHGGYGDEQQQGYGEDHQGAGGYQEQYYPGAQPGYDQHQGYDQGAVQGYGTGEFAEQPQYQDGYDQSGHWPAQAPGGYGHPGQQQGPGPDYPADETSYFDTGLIDVRQFQQQHYG
jgi:cell division septum initiation protein DivIVA